ncbi:hypothetical protein [Crenothrix sp.]|uniref:hypothetical protein n=1 Tax=Crenothrix sp. TaxID=3100433 RepID=UPI00374DBC91
MTKGVTFNGNTGPITVLNNTGIPRPSILGKLIEIIAIGSCNNLSLNRIPADIEEKIHFNNLYKYNWLIKEFISSSLLIEESIQELNQTILNGSTKLKKQMKLFYFKALNKFSINTSPVDLDKLKLHSDSIVEEVISLTINFVKSSTDLKDGYFEEDIEQGVALIISYSIIECIVLENPNDHN